MRNLIQYINRCEIDFPAERRPSAALYVITYPWSTFGNVRKFSVSVFGVYENLIDYEYMCDLAFVS